MVQIDKSGDGKISLQVLIDTNTHNRQMQMDTDDSVVQYESG